MSVIRGDFGELAIETEVVDVTSALPRPDRTWQYTDRQGHEHHWERTAETDYPTLTEVVDESCWCPACEDWHRETVTSAPGLTPTGSPSPWRRG